MLGRGADPHLQTDTGWLALLYAAEYRHRFITDLVLKAGAARNQQNQRRIAPVDLWPDLANIAPAEPRTNNPWSAMARDCWEILGDGRAVEGANEHLQGS